MEAFQALLGDDFCFLLSPHIVARTPRKRPIMTPDHADKMEITVVFQCPLLTIIHVICVTLCWFENVIGHRHTRHYSAICASIGITKECREWYLICIA